jgi:hypothetical protein
MPLRTLAEHGWTDGLSQQRFHSGSPDGHSASFEIALHEGMGQHSNPGPAGGAGLYQDPDQIQARDRQKQRRLRSHEIDEMTECKRRSKTGAVLT